ncbi:membrane protein insertion efficiency factor YidD [Coprococcus eutactus]|nr:membrane protein insertion efficiency factor YidD [Coprococcus eutactus]
MIVFFFSKSFCIWIIEIYQKYAPSKVRLSCRFEPTCSQYMKLAIYKYGVLKGVIKGVKRLTRCHPPNGGEDYP